ncbi:M55 family metallopeptidase [Anaeromicrobium sediminis]|uniref:Amino acid amidase n=1 Tax=Anaeromicrobium sediminis TaxID=1478221 RepID=A0A267MJA2_9FIRM|nr:M55 family metallopeptidase [Anaeromicrobium sediminis]PAB59527.1 amino acid amidase [Anaeromicrobium sediminis]
MKIYISADIEGITGVTSWSETSKGDSDYENGRIQMEREVNGAITGAKNKGAKDIWVKDAHETGRNIDPDSLPKDAKLLRGWSGHPFAMVEGIDDTFHACAFIGYHAASGNDGSPLSHTMNTTKIASMKINGIETSEFLIHAYAAASVGVPTVLVSGDERLCAHVKDINKNIEVVPVKKGIGEATINMHPELAVELIEEKMEKALDGDISKCMIELPKSFEVELEFTKHKDAYTGSFYPGMEQTGPTKLLYKTDKYFDVLRMISFVVL